MRLRFVPFSEPVFRRSFAARAKLLPAHAVLAILAAPHLVSVIPQQIPGEEI